MNISDFPKSNMQFYTAIRLNKGGIKERKKILRNAASNFTRRKYDNLSPICEHCNAAKQH